MVFVESIMKPSLSRVERKKTRRLNTTALYEGRPISKLQNGIILLILKI